MSSESKDVKTSEHAETITDNREDVGVNVDEASGGEFESLELLEDTELPYSEENRCGDKILGASDDYKAEIVRHFLGDQPLPAPPTGTVPLTKMSRDVAARLAFEQDEFKQLLADMLRIEENAAKERLEEMIKTANEIADSEAKEQNRKYREEDFIRFMEMERKRHQESDRETAFLLLIFSGFKTPDYREFSTAERAEPNYTAHEVL